MNNKKNYNNIFSQIILKYFIVIQIQTGFLKFELEGKYNQHSDNQIMYSHQT